MVVTTNTKATSTSPSTNNYFIPSFKMDLPGTLLHPVTLWTKHDVQKWIEHCMEEYSLQDINLNAFEMNGKALLLLNEDGFKQRSSRSGDVLHKALQQHNALIKSLTCQAFPYQFWSNLNLFPPSSIRHLNIPLSSLPPPPPFMPFIHPTVNYLCNYREKCHETNFQHLEHSIETQYISSPSSPLVCKSSDQNHIHNPMSSVKQECMDHQTANSNQEKKVSNSTTKSDLPLAFEQLNKDKSMKFLLTPESKLQQQLNGLQDTNKNNTTKKIRYYHDRVDFYGDILMKPPRAKNCRILWEFLYILLEDSSYETIIHWENREKMIFRIVQADKLAALWGLQKNRLSMTYEKLSRGMRYYYSNNIITKEQSKRLLYRFMRSPDEIRKTIKRNLDTTNMIYSTINKKSTLSLSSSPNLDRKESPTEMSNRFLQYFSVHSPTNTSKTSKYTAVNSLFLTTPNDSTLKSDRSSSSSPVSFDSNHDSGKKKYCSPSQSSSSSSLASARRKTTVPISLDTYLAHSYSVDQPLNLVVRKDEEKSFHYKKQKFIYTSSNV